MRANPHEFAAAGPLPRRLFFYNAGFLRQPRLRRILQLAGHDLRLGRPRAEDGVVVWGRSPYALRGEAVARKYNVPLVRLEDAFLRSIQPGRTGSAPLGLMIDGAGVHFDSATPSTLEQILTRHPLDDSNLLQRARDGIGRLKLSHLSKYNIHDPDRAPPPPGYVLVVDQTEGDASIRHSGARASTFREMLVFAQEENPGARIVIKTHPETAIGLRAGHYGPQHANDKITLLADAVSPWRLLEGAIAVYTVSSQLGFEAILMGHKPRVFGQPFYSGWGLSADENPVPRRERKLTRPQLFAAAMLLAPTWYDPCRDRLCSFEDTLDQLEAEVRAFREDRYGYVASGMRLWKRGRLQAFFGAQKPVVFQKTLAKSLQTASDSGRDLLVWGLPAPTAPLAVGAAQPEIRHIEDGFLRSRGLGADLVPPLSLVSDDLGLYYDPSRESRLERQIAQPLPPGAVLRVTKLIEKLIEARLSKYNLAEKPALSGADAASDSGALINRSVPPTDAILGTRAANPRSGLNSAPATRAARRCILVPGQVEDDASIRLGVGTIRSNLALLQATRAANPRAYLIYKPHPDVEAGLRIGKVTGPDLTRLADEVARNADPIALLDRVDEVWTMTSLLGFEALLRGIPVTTLGAPFYAGWGLTRDLGKSDAPNAAAGSLIPQRRRRAADGHALPRRDLLHLAYATLIAYPRYYDPVSKRPCPPEVIIARLASGRLPRAGLPLRLLAKVQGALASQAWLWRR